MLPAFYVLTRLKHASSIHLTRSYMYALSALAVKARVGSLVIPSLRSVARYCNLGLNTLSSPQINVLAQ